MKKFLSVMLSLFFALLFPVFSRAISFDEFSTNAQGMAVFDVMGQKMLYEKNSHKQLPVASTTKIMTTAIALEQNNLDAVFEVDPVSIMVEGSSMGLLPKDKVSLRTLCYGMMLPSGNDAANAAAVRICGNISDFVECMNKKAKSLRLNDTKFSTPSGLDNGENLSSAHDMARLADYALKNEDFAGIVKTKTTAVDVGDRNLWLSNHNRLLSMNSNVNGVKTGFTKKAGRCLVSSANIKGRSFIVVTLNCYDDFNVHNNIYKKIEADLNEISISDVAKTGKAAVVGGMKKEVAVAPLKDVKVSLLTDELQYLTTEFATEQFLYAPVALNVKAGIFAVKVKGSVILTVPVFTIESVDKIPYREGPFDRQIFDYRDLLEDWFDEILF